MLQKLPDMLILMLRSFPRPVGGSSSCNNVYNRRPDDVKVNVCSAHFTTRVAVVLSVDNAADSRATLR